MGSGKAYSMKETSATRSASSDHAFEEILERIISAGGDVERDEVAPLYTDIGMEEHEVGNIREIEFNLNRNDFRLSREVETHKIQGAGKQKSLEELEPPRIKLKLLKKPEIGSDWQVVDLEALL